MKSSRKPLNAFSGRWPLKRAGEIALGRAGLDETASLNVRLIAAEPDALVLGVAQAQAGQRVVARTARVSGKWRVDSRNRLLFFAEKGKGRGRTVSFGAGWELDGANEITIEAGRGERVTLRGRWELDGPRTLVYSLEGGSAELRFRGAFQTKSILAKDGEIRWQLGAETAARRGGRSIGLFGKWKLRRDLGLDFEWERGARGAARLSFGASYNVGDRRGLAVGLVSRRGEPLGTEVVFTRDFERRSGGLFARLEKNAREALVEGGVSLKW
ncbi:MAG TPA: hypothetical protein VL404_09745 [Candidatus Eisenbacteria bacterium]|nr:hypothetical protein [Candidatus Eisenbacteria bacterium]